MAYRHLIWDWNGTLLDDAWLCLEVMNGLMTRRSMRPVTARFYQEEFGFPVVEYYRKLGFDLERDSFEAVSREFIDGYNRRRLECSLYPEVRATVEAVRAQGVGQVILSAHEHRTLVELVGLLGLDGYFSQLIGLDNIYAAGKAANGRAHMASLPHAPHEVLLVGDTTHDYEVAREIGADCVLLEGGHQSRARLEACGVPVLRSHIEVLALL
ncbi:HAD family hydrolase [Ruficoccus amylovorans]|uniref:phosphoglycolate phosphatase n=1 Tax=Ruficoccus amylovorans TaxID=1804625 RepID=A0A842HFR7_9BACT|nr:HAD hydrolase-like protein [Ruficoccus amylovorans]MBC2595505.1 HAD family hydrolase [Ruficoccus amylovorans]